MLEAYQSILLEHAAAPYLLVYPSSQCSCPRPVRRMLGLPFEHFNGQIASVNMTICVCRAQQPLPPPGAPPLSYPPQAPPVAQYQPPLPVGAPPGGPPPAQQPLPPQPQQQPPPEPALAPQQPQPPAAAPQPPPAAGPQPVPYAPAPSVTLNATGGGRGAPAQQQANGRAPQQAPTSYVQAAGAPPHPPASFKLSATDQPSSMRGKV